MFSIILIAVVFTAIANAEPTVFRDCGTSRSPMKFQTLRLPSPLIVDRENQASTKFTLAKDLKPDDYLQITLEARGPSLPFMPPTRIPIPCVPGLNIGSCRLTLKTWYDMAPDMMCSVFKQFQLPCEAKMAAGEYKKDNFPLIIDSKIIPNVPGSLINNRYYAKLNFGTHNGESLGCFQLEADIKKF